MLKSVSEETQNEKINNSNIDNQIPFNPDFNEKLGKLNNEMIQDWISILLKENRERIQEVNDTFQLFLEPQCVQYVFTICLKLHLPHEVKYIAVAIFSEFMVIHIASLYNMIYDLLDQDIEKKIKEWKKVESTISRQLTLRMVSCIQIASKIYCYNECLSTKRARRCLQFLGFLYTEDAVRKSELRVLMSLNFLAKTRHTPVIYIETFLAILNVKYENILLNTTKLWEYSLLFLDCVFLKLDAVYKRILLIIHGKEAQNLPKDRRLRLQADYTLLATGVIAAACVSVYGMEFSEQVIETLSAVSFISSADILDVSTGIMKTIIEHKPTKPKNLSSCGENSSENS